MIIVCSASPLYMYNCKAFFEDRLSGLSTTIEPRGLSAMESAEQDCIS